MEYQTLPESDLFLAPGHQAGEKQAPRGRAVNPALTVPPETLCCSGIFLKIGVFFFFQHETSETAGGGGTRLSRLSATELGDSSQVLRGNKPV